MSTEEDMMVNLDQIDAMAETLDPRDYPARAPRTSVLDRLRRQQPAIDTAKYRPMATDKQINYIHVLTKQLKDHNPDVWANAKPWIDANVDKLTKEQATDTINRLKGHLAAPAKPAERSVCTIRPDADTIKKSHAWSEWRTLAAQLVELGGHTGARFAVDNEPGSDNDLAFWWIVPNEGPHGTRYFLRQVIGGQGAVRVRMSVEAMITIAQKIIAADPKEAMLRFGREIGSCGHCGRALTNQVSREAGIGPVCAKRRTFVVAS